MTQNNKLPKDWRIVKLKDIATLSSQKHSPVKPEDLFYIGLEHIEKHTGKLTSKVGLDKITTIKNKFSKGDILYGKLRPNLNKVYLSKEEGVCSTDILVLKLSEECLGKYLHPIMFSTTFVNEMSDNTSGVNLPRVSTKFIMNFEIPLPPLETQSRIVSKIDELFSELDKGIEDLKTAQQQLKIYRQSVLKWAFEGKLTNEKVKDGELPKGWKIVMISEIAKIETGTTPPKINPKFYGDQYPFYKPTDLEAGNNVFKSRDGLTELGVKHARYVPEFSTLVTCIGATIGKTGFIKTGGGFNQQINAIVPNKNINPKFIYYQAIGLNFNKQILDNASATTLPIINKGKFQILKMVNCLIEEQNKIVQEIENRLSVADKMEESIAQSLLQAEALRQSILKKAFSGELV